ncbi:MAG: hypothetical protein H6844_16135 [Alphaproteobacteria bacterium]|nr:hypothetical protein [Alphaproteobacteria bacterium]
MDFRVSMGSGAGLAQFRRAIAGFGFLILALPAMLWSGGVSAGDPAAARTGGEVLLTINGGDCRRRR